MKTVPALLLIISTLSFSQENINLEPYVAHYGLTYEKVTISENENMDLVGLNMLFDINENYYAGINLYGAVAGVRGGFFTLGINGGFQYELMDKMKVKSGLFVGAGGGGAAPQGGGLMLRPYAELDYKLKDVTLGLGISHVRFPNGDISSSQAYLSLSVPTEGCYIKGHIFDDTVFSGSETNEIETNNVTLSFLTEQYKPKASSLNTGGKTSTEPYTLAGIKLDKYVNDSLYGYFQAAGAGGGDSAGYMEIFGGMGYRYQLSNLPLYLGLEAALGAAGGGKVDTGGGLIYRGQGTFSAVLGDHLSLSAFAGTIAAFNGTFSAEMYGLTIGYNTSIVNALSQNTLENSKTSAWRFRVMEKSYLNAEKIFQTHRNIDRVDLLGLAVDRYLNPNIYITGQTFWAFDGEAGGYAEGIFGLGFQSDPWYDFSLYTELLAGVGGGGGIDVGGGFFVSGEAGINYDITPSWALSMGTSYMRTYADTFSTTAVKVGLNYRFSLLELK